MEGGRVSGMASRQDEGSFEDALRRLNALELKLTEQVKIDIHDLKQTWLQPKVDRVTRNAYKLFQVREQLKSTKSLFVEEEHILNEFNNVKEMLKTNSMDEEEFDATRETCLFLGSKLTEIRRRQANCYSENKDLEVVINKEIMKLKFEEKDFSDLDLEEVRASTPVRQMSPTPLERHRSRSRDPSPFRMPPFKLGTGTITPGGSFRSGGGTITPGGTIVQDPHAYFSRPGSSQSVYGGRGGLDPELEAFRKAMEEKQKEDDSPPADRRPHPPFMTGIQQDGFVLRSSSGQELAKSASGSFLDPSGNYLNPPGSFFVNERPASAMSDASLHFQDGGEISRPGSRMEAMGDVVSSAWKLGPSVGGEAYAGNEFLGDEMDEDDVKINFELEQQRKEQEQRSSAEAEMERMNQEAARLFEEKEKAKREEEAKKKKEEEERVREKKRIEAEEKFKEKERLKQEEEKKFKEREEKRKKEKEKRDLEEKQKKELEEKKKEEERLKKIEEKKEKKRKADKAARQKEEEEAKAAEEKKKRLEDKKKLVEQAKQKKLEEEKAKEQELIAEKKALEKDVSDLEQVLDSKIIKEDIKKSEENSKNSTEQAGQKSRDSSRGRVDKKPEEVKSEPKLKSRSKSRGEKEENKLDVESAPINQPKEEVESDLHPRSRSKGRAGENQGKDEKSELKSRSQSRGRIGVKDDENNSEKATEKMEDKTVLSYKDDKNTTNEQQKGIKSRDPSRDQAEKRSSSASKGINREDETKNNTNNQPQQSYKSEEGSENPPNVNARGRKPKKSVPLSPSENEFVTEIEIGAGELQQMPSVKESESQSTKPRSLSRRRLSDEKKDMEAKSFLEDNLKANKHDSSDNFAPEADEKPRSKTGSRQTSRAGSPISILKKGGSRDASRDRSGNMEPELEDVSTGKPLSRTGSLKKSGSFSKRSMFAEKKKISFDNEVEVEQFDTDGEPLNAAKEIFAAIANTSLESGIASRRPKSRDSSGDRTSYVSPAEPAEYYPPDGSEFDNEDELMIIIDNPSDGYDPELAALHSRSQSRERPGSRGQNVDNSEISSGLYKSIGKRGSDDKYPQSLLKSRSGSGVPELESILDVPSQGAQSGRRSLSGDRSHGDSRPSSTGYTQLDEFEQKLAQMESELEKEDNAGNSGMERSSSLTAETGVTIGNYGENENQLKRGDNMWDLSPTLGRAINETEDFNIVAAEFKENFEKEDVYAKVVPKLQREKMNQSGTKTDDGFVINPDSELSNIDYSTLKDEYTYEDDGSEYIYDEQTGQPVRRTKKVSFAEEDERFVIERPGEVKGLGFTKLFSFGPPKPMKSLPGKDKKADSLDIPPMAPSRTSPRRSTSKEPSPMFQQEVSAPKAFISAMTGGLIGGKSPDTHRREAGSSSVFGTLLNRGRKGSKPGSKTGSRTSSLDRSSQDLGSEDGEGSNMRTSSIGSYGDDNDDARSDSSFVKRLGLKKKKKPPKVQSTDFDELFARGMAMSAQLESQNVPIPNQKDQTLTEGNTNGQAAGNARYDETGARFTPFEVYSHDEAFRRTQKEEGIGYAEKVLSYLDDQAHSPRPSIGLIEPSQLGNHQERSRERKKHRPKETPGTASVAENPQAKQLHRSLSNDKRKRSREYAKPEDIKLSPMPKRDLFTGKEIPASPEAQFLRKVTEFVQSHQVDLQYSQPVWPAIASSNQLPPLRDSEDLLTTLDRISPMIAPQGQTVNTPDETSDTNTFQVDRDAYGSGIARPTNQTAATVAASVTTAASAVSPPRFNEPGDKGIPAQLMPDKLLANEEFYEKLRSGLKNISSEADEGINYGKYSHHLGRAEFGTLRRKETSIAASSRDPSGDRIGRTGGGSVAGTRDPSGDRQSRAQGSVGAGSTMGPGVLSRNQSSDKLIRLPAKKLSRQGSGASSDQWGAPPRSDSRLSDYSGALPDLESQMFDDEDGPILFAADRENRTPTVHRTQSLLVGGAKAVRPPMPEPVDVLQKKEEVLRDIAQHKQQIREAKAWIQNGLMTAVGFCVVVYLQSLEMMAGQS